MATLKGGEFLIKQIPANEIFSIEELNEEQKMLRDSAKEFIDREVVPQRERFEKKDYAFTEETMRKLGDMGLLGIAVPEEYGGLGMGFVTTMLACDYISGTTGSLATAYGAHTGIGTLPIVLYGTEEQKKKYLPDLATGTKFGAYCLTEPDAGSDANSGKTKAKLSEDGKHYIINGQKMWISNAGFADTFTLFAKIDDDKNITGFVINRSELENPESLTFGEEEHKLGIRASSTRQVFFNDMKIPVENLLGERNNGFKIALNALNVGRIKLAAACLDAQRRILNHSIQYSNERKQFGVSIATFGAIRKKLAEMATGVFVSEAGSYRAAKNVQDKIDELVAGGLSHQEAELKGVEEFAVECSILKVFVSDLAQHTADEGIQVYGGMGFSEDTPMEAAWRDSRISRIYEGTNEINRLLAVGMLIKRAMKGELDLLSPAMAISKELMGIPSFEVPDYSEFMSEEKAIIANLKKVFLMVSGAALQKYMMDIEKQQHLLLNASEILNQIYMAESAVLRAEKHFSPESVEAAMAQLNLYKAVEKIITAAKEGIVSFAEGDEQRMMLSGLRRFTKYTNHPNVVALTEKVAAHYIEKGAY
ncbi:alkylation response protein AidB-like acyl-CoA dehydrogenase [Chryseobacterium bernardetii]|jgi:alkylation response protein AidB-like acyl-CoA dehydrogenase|uniref:Alkylation response protein AidB-like acyl-CoA dehydrogenase n=3 Tax=Chryseobacterium TaxID=59732 RepID=A0A543EIA1_9FLAO|nr:MULTISPECIES: acyl-CoA dehydrogenase family protein [Chryseobacterium]MDR6371224.1 alkylation response protein AidB-like acyl-CoA dehydrogenase [Chryseobacterium vietnamense]MDR6441030.1 alkylation response protein AidB-like acyl-CoA dehydrogenase [Chryseobacterium bernardetii]MDR6457756.1 alkylation response protein AidB-like acyl-CoA dehydrogenase [Chryseobacterium vietnamense]MDR6486465.1 alkylation response protein AidB-like acyl-CoA dehydrogenase [Chryseobacterium vietnamense]TQM21293.